MKLRIETSVEQSPAEVMAGFTRELFLQLSPPFPPVRLLRFDGCASGDEVWLQLDFLFFKQNWTAWIVESGERDGARFFVDEGRELPFFLRRWRHAHWVAPDADGGSRIIDDIEFDTPVWLPAALMYPALWLQFARRKPIYRRVFAKSRAATPVAQSRQSR